MAGGKGGDRIVRKFGVDMYTLLYLKWITNKDLLYSTGNSVQCYVAAWMGGKLGGEWVIIYEWFSLFLVHLKLSQHCLLISYTPRQNKKFKEKLCCYICQNCQRHCVTNGCGCVSVKLCLQKQVEGCIWP